MREIKFYFYTEAIVLLKNLKNLATYKSENNCLDHQTDCWNVKTVCGIVVNA